jgi:hypothetical protein
LELKKLLLAFSYLLLAKSQQPRANSDLQQIPHSEFRTPKSEQNIHFKV